YMSPEQLLGQPVDQRSDLFAVGVILYELVARRAPFKGNSAIGVADAILHSEPPPLPDKAVPLGLKALIGRLLSKDQAGRPSTAAEAIASIRAVEASLDPSRRGLSRAARLTLVAAAVAVLALGVWFWRRSSRERWVHNVATPEIARLVDGGEFVKAAGLLKTA